MAIESKNLLVAIKAYSRANPLPLDASEVHESLEAAQIYAASAKAYPGQTIKVLQNGVYETYVLNPSDTGLTLGKVTVDESSIKNYVQIVETLPEEGQEQGVIYIDSELKGQFWDGSQWKVIFEQVELEDGNPVSVSDAILALNTEISDIQEIIEVINGDASIEGSVDYKIAEAIVNADHLKRKIVTELPQEDIDVNTIYMYANRETGDDIYDEYMYIEGEWEVLGNTVVDLTDYYTKTEVQDTFATIAALADYAKLSDLPVVPTALSAFTNDVGYLTEHQDLSAYAKTADLPDFSTFATSEDLKAYATEDYVAAGMSALNAQIAAAATKTELEALDAELEAFSSNVVSNYATQDYVAAEIAKAQIGGDGSSDIDLSAYVLHSELDSTIGDLKSFSSVTDYVNAAISGVTLNVIEF